LKRIKKLDPNEPLPDEDAIAHDWLALKQAFPTHDKYEESVYEAWKAAGCAKNDPSASYVIRAVARFIVGSFRSPYAMMALKSPLTERLAKAFLDKKICSNAANLSDETRVVLESIAGGSLFLSAEHSQSGR